MFALFKQGCAKPGTGYYRLQGSRVGYTEIPGYILLLGPPHLRGPPFSTVRAPFSLKILKWYHNLALSRGIKHKR